jgi:hypothetical protein
MEFSRQNISGLTVELLDPDVHLAHEPESHFAIHPNEPIVALWSAIQPQILRLIEDFPWSTLSVVRRRRNSNRFEKCYYSSGRHPGEH